MNNNAATPHYLLALKQLLMDTYEQDGLGVYKSLNKKGQVIYTVQKPMKKSSEFKSSDVSIAIGRVDMSPIAMAQAQDKRFMDFVNNLIENLNSNTKIQSYYDLSALECFNDIIAVHPGSYHGNRFPLSQEQVQRLSELCINHTPVSSHQMLLACLKHKDRVKNRTDLNDSEKNIWMDYYQQCFITVFMQGVDYDLTVDTNKMVFGLSSFCIKLKKLALPDEQSRNVLLEHLKNSKGLYQESFEKKLSICNEFMKTPSDKKEFLRLVFQNEHSHVYDSVEQVPELKDLVGNTIVLAKNPIVAIELNKRANIFIHEFNYEEELQRYLGYILPTINEYANHIGLSEVSMQDDGSMLTLLAKSIDENPPQTQLLIDIIDTCLKLYKETMKPRFPSMPDADSFKKSDLGFDVSRVILKLKLDNGVNHCENEDNTVSEKKFKI
jgi:hypothetical protein